MRTLLAVSLVAATALVVACGSGGSKTKNSADQPFHEKYTPVEREKFREVMHGKTKAEVLEILGKPTSTNEAGGTEYWSYDKVTTDPVSGKVDYSTTLWFDEEGKVRRISF